ncbi:BatA domain-containing protein [Gilvibacter sp.]|uniref:BatA domain-containing protein n=1 Tax=Gilvibacter sp. TaxID=2729997 RepID=UPI003B523150
MQFKNPEIFYALLLLLIPILVHLFQLRRFVKVPFTNVAFLKEIQLKTRKSSTLKKWLVLTLRCLALAALVTAFAQPFLAEKQADDKEDEYLFYLDNSYSMTARSDNANLLADAVQRLYDNPPLGGNFRWFTNTEDYFSESEADFRNSLLEVNPTFKQYTYKELLLKAAGSFSSQDTNKQLVLLSDFQSRAFANVDTMANIDVLAVQLRPRSAANVSIDSAYIQTTAAGNTVLKVQLSAAARSNANYPVSLFKAEALSAKSAVSFNESLKAEVEFPITLEESYLGRLSINDQELEFDNELYFSLGEQTAIKVMSINQAERNYLDKLFPAPEFELVHNSHTAADYNAILQQNVVVLNELERIPAGLSTALLRFKENGGVIIVVPAPNADTTEYQRLLSQLDAGSFSEAVSQERKLNTINFDHPLFNGVFNQQVTNFQYPTVNTFFDLSSSGNDPLTLEGQNPFLVQFENVYVFASPLSSPHSNFKESPLIVPSFYNMAKKALPIPVLYYELGKPQEIALAVSLSEDQIVQLNGSQQQFIPLQQRFANKLVLQSEEHPTEPGHYFALNQSDTLAVLSYNNPRAEADLRLFEATDLNGIDFYDNLSELLSELQQAGEQRPLWQWFVLLCVIFLLLEMAILRFFK